MAARVVEVCEAVAAYIATERDAGRYGFPFHVRRRNYGLSDLKLSGNQTFLYVYPGTYSPGPNVIRETFARTITVVLDMVNFVDSEDGQAEVDDALLLAERLERSFDTGYRVGEFGFKEFGDINSGREPFEVERLDSENRFHVVIPLIFVGAYT